MGKFCMNLAIKKAKETGVGWVVCYESNHYGIAGYYAMMASEQGEFLTGSCVVLCCVVKTCVVLCCTLVCVCVCVCVCF